MDLRGRGTGRRAARRPVVRTVLACVGLVWSGPIERAVAQRIENEVAVFAALDKVTARISRLEVRLNETVRFGSLKITPRTCFSRQPIEPPRTTSFVEVDETMLDGKEKRIFAGWIFAESPGLNALEHAVYDLWLTGCHRAPDAASKTEPGKKGDGSSAAVTPTPQPPAKKRPPR